MPLQAALNSTGFVVRACRFISKRGVNCEDFLAWVREDLCGLDAAGEPIGGRDPATGNRSVPSLLRPYDPDNPVPNSILVLGNAKIHHSDEFPELVQSTGALACFLRPYGPGTFVRQVRSCALIGPLHTCFATRAGHALTTNADARFFACLRS